MVCKAVAYWSDEGTWLLRWHCNKCAAVRARTCYPPSHPRFECSDH